MPHLQWLSNNLSPEALCDVSKHIVLYIVRLLASHQTPKLEDHSGRLSTIAYSIYSQLNTIPGKLLPNPQTEECAMPCGDRNPRMDRYYTFIFVYFHLFLRSFNPSLN